MKKWLKKLWREVREWLEEATGWNSLDLGDFGLTDESSFPAEAGAVPDGGDTSDSSMETSAGEEFSVGSSDGGRNDDTTGDNVDFAALEWRYGGFKGGKATLSDRARIKGLKVTRNGLSYSWESGGCEDLGASGPHDAACLACLFCHVGGRWIGGKFDWISTDRTSRGFENIEERYGGWEYEAFRDADAYAFVIVSGNGKLRTNVIVQTGRN